MIGVRKQTHMFVKFINQTERLTPDKHEPSAMSENNFAHLARYMFSFENGLYGMFETPQAPSLNSEGSMIHFQTYELTRDVSLLNFMDR